MSYTLRSHISTGRIDTDDFGSFEIRESELEVDDYETAAALVERYTVEWPDGDPQAEAEAEAEAEAADSDEDAEDEGDAEDAEDDDDNDDDDDDEGEEFDAAEFVDRTPMAAVVDDIESGEYDDHLDAIESEASRRGVLDAVDARREE